MILSGRELHPNGQTACDVCIIGAGAAGIVLACELENSGLDIVVLEAGGLSFVANAQEGLSREGRPRLTSPTAPDVSPACLRRGNHNLGRPLCSTGSDRSVASPLRSEQRLANHLGRARRFLSSCNGVLSGG